MDNLIEKELQEEVKPEVKKILHRIFHSRYFRWLKEPLAIILIIHYIAGFIAVKTGTVDIHLDFLKRSNVNISGIQQTGNGNQVNVLAAQTQCLFKYCSDFKDGKWKYQEEFKKIQDNPLILESPNNPVKPGATMYYDQEVGHFTLETIVAPMATASANLAIAYGKLTRCIIGDGSYQSIACQINESYPKEPKDWSYFDEKGNLYGRFSQFQISKFEPGKELQIRYEYKNIDGNDTITIKLNDHVPLVWRIPKRFQGIVKTDMVGLSLFTTKYDDVQAVFKSFNLDSNL